MSIPRLATERLLLREFRESDLDAMAVLMANPEVTRFITADGNPKDREVAWRTMAGILGHWTLRGFGMWALEEKAGGAFVGYAGALYPEGWPEREIGWTLTQAQWGKGYAREAARAAMDFARDTLHWPRVIHVIHPDNVRSAAVAAHLGSRITGTWERNGHSLNLYGQDLRI